MREAQKDLKALKLLREDQRELQLRSTVARAILRIKRIMDKERSERNAQI